MPGLFFLRTIKITDIIDIIIVSYLIYKVIVFFRNTRAYQLIKGIALLLIFSQLSEMFHLNTISYILKNTMQVGLIAIVVLFQAEIRKALSKMGSKGFKLFNFEDNDDDEQIKYIVKQIKDASFNLSKLGYGALMVIERDIKIGDIIRTGVNLDSEITSELMVNIFVPNTPLHDGAVIIGDHKIKAAACFLPLSQNEAISNELGTRHRAGIGITESTDAVVVIVSEETGKISVAMDGELSRNMSEEKLTDILTKAFTRELGYNKRNKVWRFKKNGK
ncbi:MAG: TIGR00159 family protein [Ruminococcaceae bacterium]|nr:TIGR00159 family protein [Oscillospiraceae bacterium]